jgi:hypothetical protein
MQAAITECACGQQLAAMVLRYSKCFGAGLDLFDEGQLRPLQLAELRRRFAASRIITAMRSAMRFFNTPILAAA